MTVSVLDLVRGRYVDAAGRLALHEAGHAAVAVFAGLRVESATIERTARERPGLVRLVSTDPSRGHLLAVMAGPLTDGEPIAWPPLDMGDGSDEALAATCVAAFGLDLEGWLESAELTEQMLALRPVKRARSAIAAALYEHGSLAGPEVHRVFDDASASAARNR